MKRRRVSIRDHERFQAALRVKPAPEADDDPGWRLDHPPALRSEHAGARLLAILDELQPERGDR